jgi:outer membrane assembly lipoprotein YfiO
MKNLKVFILIGGLVFSLKGYGVAKDKNIVDRYIENLKSESIEVRKDAVIWLGNRKIKSAVPKLIETLNNEKDKNTRYWIVHYLGEIGGSSAIPVLIKIFENDSEDIDIRCAAGHSLGLINDKAAIPTLIKALENDNGGIQLTAVLALGEIGDESAIPALKEILRKKKYYNLTVPKEIEIAIKKIKSRKQTPIIIELLKKGDDLLKEAQKYKAESKYEEAIEKWREYLKLYDDKLRNIEHWQIPIKFSEYHYLLNARWEAIFNIAKCYEDLEIYEKAIETYKEAINAEEGPITYYKYRIKFLQENKDSQREPLRLLIQAERKIEGDKYNEAIDQLKMLIRTYPKSSLVDEAYFFMAQCTHQGYNEVFKAIDIYNTIVTTYPQTNMADDAQFMIALLYEDEGDWEKSIDEYRTVVNKFPSQLQDFLFLWKICGEFWTKAQTASIAQFMIGQIYRREKMYLEAINAYQRLIDAYPQSPFVPSAMHYIGKCYEELGNYMLAAKIYERISDTFPENVPVWHSWTEEENKQGVNLAIWRLLAFTID